MVLDRQRHRNEFLKKGKKKSINMSESFFFFFFSEEDMSESRSKVYGIIMILVFIMSF